MATWNVVDSNLVALFSWIYVLPTSHVKRCGQYDLSGGLVFSWVYVFPVGELGNIYAVALMNFQPDQIW